MVLVPHTAVLMTVLLSVYASWPGWLPELDALVVRQDTAAAAPAPAATPVPPSQSPPPPAEPPKLDDPGPGAVTGPPDGAAPPDGTPAETQGRAGTTNMPVRTDPVSVDPQAPPGNAVVMTPQTTLTSALYRIGEWVTLGWNYTNVQVFPTAVDVVISCTTASESWTLTSNMTFETSAAITWDTAAFQSASVEKPLLVEQYVLYIYDSEESLNAPAGPGELQPAAAMTFGLYTGQPYTPLASGWVCATCSGAISSAERQALGLLLTVAAITVVTFTCFVTGLW